MNKTSKQRFLGSAHPNGALQAETARTTMNGKPVLWRKAKTVLSENEAFQEKLLCDGLTLNAGDLCTFSCAFCYVESQIWKLVHGEVREFNQKTGVQRQLFFPTGDDQNSPLGVRGVGALGGGAEEGEP